MREKVGVLPDAELLRVDEAAAMLGLSESHLIEQTFAGRIPGGTKIGGARRWIKSALHEWIASGCPKPSARESGGE